MSNYVYAFPSLGDITHSGDKICAYVHTNTQVRIGMTTASGYGSSGCGLYATSNPKNYNLQTISRSQWVCWTLSGESPGTRYAIVKIWHRSVSICFSGKVREFTICSAGWKCRDNNHRGYQNTDCSWSSVTFCAHGCSNGVCNACSPGWKCRDNNHRGYQNTDCSWSSVTFCANGCSNGVCNACSPGWKCRDNNHRGYQNTDCSWSSVTFCANGCSNGVCRVCTPGTTQCNGSNLMTCNAAGTGWDTTPCPSGQTCQNGQCTNLGISYCAANSRDHRYEYITKVELNTGSRSSSGSTYSDYTNSVFTTLNLGQQYTLKVTGKTNGNYRECVKAWIDFNQDGDFSDSGEEIDMGCHQFSGEYTFSKTFSVPPDAKSGNPRMRVALQYFNPPKACGTFYWGEVEDYTINIKSVDDEEKDTDETSCPSITNGGFESDTRGWVFGGQGDHKIGTIAYSGAKSALIGFKDSPNVANGKDYVYQTITVPNGSKVVLSFYYRFYSHDYCNYDFFHMRIRDSNGNVKSTVISKCHSGWGLKDTSWIKKEVDLTSYAGQTIQIYFEVENRVDALHKSWAYIDDVKIECEIPQTVCIPNEQVCDGNNIKKCKSDGSGWNNNYRACSNRCYGGECLDYETLEVSEYDYGTLALDLAIGGCVDFVEDPNFGKGAWCVFDVVTWVPGLTGAKVIKASKVIKQATLSGEILKGISYVAKYKFASAPEVIITKDAAKKLYENGFTIISKEGELMVLKNTAKYYAKGGDKTIKELIDAGVSPEHIEIMLKRGVDLTKVKPTADYLKSQGLRPTWHLVEQMLLRKISKETVIDVWENGAKYSRTNADGTIDYIKWKNGIAIAYDPITKNLLTTYPMKKITSTWVPI